MLIGLLYAGVVVAALPWIGRVDLTVGSVLAILVLAAMIVVSVTTRGSADDAMSSSFTTVLLLAAIPLAGPLPAATLGLLSPLADRRYLRSRAGVFNSAMIGLATLLGGWAYTALSGPQPVPTRIGPATLLLSVGGPLLVADLVMALVNVAALSAMVALSGGRATPILRAAPRELLPLHLAYGLIAFVFVALWRPAGVGPLSVILIVAPLAIARFVYVQYGDEQRAHRTIVDLVRTAADTADRRLSRQGERVAELCALIADQMGLAEADRRDLVNAARLHDIGMKSVVGAGDQRLAGAPDMRILWAHPGIAADLVARVDFLAGAAPAVRGHHERYDGRGYPDGLAGEAIPLTARILAVADALDALLSTEGDRSGVPLEIALGMLDAAAGTQFDPRVVGAAAAVAGARTLPAATDEASQLGWLWDQHRLPALSAIVADEIVDAGLAPVRQPAGGTR